MRKRFMRYNRLLIIVLVAVISITGMALVNLPQRGMEYWSNLEMTTSIEEVIDHTLSWGFASSLKEVDHSTVGVPFEMNVEKGYRIDNNLVDYGMIYHGTVGQNFNNDKVFRKMLNVLSDNYLRIRRNDQIEKNNETLQSFEEHGYVYDLTNRYAYVNKLIISDNEAWVLMLTYDENARARVRELLDRIWIEEEKGVRIS